jgi:type I restriction enzyme S subunit
MRPYFHKVCMAPFDGTTRTTAFVLFPKTKEDFVFATLLLHHSDTIDYATRHSTGSTIPYAVWGGSLEEMPAVIPPREIRRSFDAVIRPILTRIPVPYFENRTLAAIRDALLPKLMSGELEVCEV